MIVAPKLVQTVNVIPSVWIEEGPNPCLIRTVDHETSIKRGVTYLNVAQASQSAGETNRAFRIDDAPQFLVRPLDAQIGHVLENGHPGLQAIMDKRDDRFVRPTTLIESPAGLLCRRGKSVIQRSYLLMSSGENRADNNQDDEYEKARKHEQMPKESHTETEG